MEQFENHAHRFSCASVSFSVKWGNRVVVRNRNVWAGLSKGFVNISNYDHLPGGYMGTSLLHSADFMATKVGFPKHSFDHGSLPC